MSLEIGHRIHSHQVKPIPNTDEVIRWAHYLAKSDGKKRMQNKIPEFDYDFQDDDDNNNIHKMVAPDTIDKIIDNEVKTINDNMDEKDLNAQESIVDGDIDVETDDITKTERP